MRGRAFSPREPSHERSNHPNLRPRLRADIPRHRRARSSGRRQHHAGLLDLPDERLPDLRDAVRGLWRARRQLCRRPGAEGPVRPQ
ncbi:hypothetical protein chiPu_0032326, partial [Chiloscyllium punctatum]|nr:hypothetical protein [Chiloscyllium punctatum]